MIKQIGLTKIDLIVALACAVFVFVNVQVISAGGRERSKREVCLANLRTLTAAWQIYAQDNAGKIVNAAPMTPGGFCQECSDSCKAKAPVTPTDPRYNELPWTGPGWNQMQWSGGVPASVCCQKCAISTGALWKYTKDYDIYQCPTGIKGQMVSYDIVDSMNGMFEWRSQSQGGMAAKPYWNKNLGQIIKPAMRIVFIEEGLLTPDSFGVFYDREMWFDLPAVRHGDGTNVSFADGHSAFWKWKAKETIDIAKSGIYGFQPVTSACKQDLYKLQIACWSKLGYYPTVAPDPNW
jgi:prepilin-type processing-associated H-X9-DG protein